MLQPAPRFAPLLVALVLTAPLRADAVSSGAFTSDVKLAVTDFVKNATQAASDGGLLEKGIPCRTAKQTPQQLSANQMRRAVNEMRVGQAGEIFGNATLDAIAKAAELNPATKGIATGAGLLKDYLASRDLADFAGRVFKGKLKGKITGKVKDAIGKDAYKGAETLYKAIEKQLQQQATKAFGSARTVSSACGGAGDRFQVKVDLAARSIEVTLAGSCDCSKGGVKSHSGVLRGRVQLRERKGQFLWRFVLTGMRFDGECCGGRKGRPRTWGAIPSPAGGGSKVGGDPGDYTGGTGCDGVDCGKLHEALRQQHQRLQGLNDTLKQLDSEDPQRGDLGSQRYAAITSIERICEDLNRCCQDKAPPAEIRKLMGKYCVRRDFSFGLLPGGDARVGALGEGFAVSYDRSEWCTYGGGTTRVPPATATPTPGAPPSTGPPPLLVAVPTPEASGDEEEVPTTAPPTPTPPPAEEEPPASTPRPTLTIKAKQSVLIAGRLESRAVPQAMIKLNLAPTPALPLAGHVRDDSGYDEDPVQGLTDERGELSVTLPASVAASAAATQMDLDLTSKGSTLVHLDPAAGDDPRSSLAKPLHPYLQHSFAIGSALVAVLTYDKYLAQQIQQGIAESQNVLYQEENTCREKQQADPYFRSQRSWGQAYADQWAIHRVGITPDADSAWSRLGDDPAPVLVAVIDTGLDWNHRDLDWSRIWKNPGETPGNGLDDDGNGYVDDVVGWDFFGGTDAPFDRDGHGTFVAGVIGASTDNGVGIAGIDPHAVLLPVKALNDFGHTRASYLAEALVYAADQGARVINLSVGGKHPTRAEKLAVDYAHAKGAVVVVAAGNEGVDVADFGPAGLEHVVVVGASNLDDGSAVFSNWGAAVDLVAPGTDVLSLRARRTDLMRDIPEVEYEPGAAVVGADRRYYRASGTSFSAPIVAGVASLLLSKRPELSPDEVERILVHSARDIGVPGVDRYTGYGLVDARAALDADPAFFVEARIEGVEAVVEDGATLVRVRGTADADRFVRAWLEIGPGAEPEQWRAVGKQLAAPVRGGEVGRIPAAALQGEPRWTLRLRVEHSDGTLREARFLLTLG